MQRTCISRLMVMMAAVLTCAAQAAVPAPPAAPRNLAELKLAVEAIRKEAKIPALGIALVDRNGPVWVAGLGQARLAPQVGADADTLFRIGSTSKMFVALAILKLVDEGKLALNDPVRRLAPEIAFENPWEKTHPVRLAHLLQHTTGWDDFHPAEMALSAPDSMTTREGLDFHPDSRRSRWVPGTRHAYANAGPAVAAYIVEKLSGQRFEDYVATNFFQPLGMMSTGYFEDAQYRARGATLYTDGKAEPYWRVLMRPAGAIHSSPADMAKFMQFLVARGAAPNGRLVSLAAFDRMETPATTVGNARGISAGYGLGNTTSGHLDRQVAFHGHNGFLFGGLTEASYVNELGTGYVLMLNSGDWPAFFRLSKLIRGYLLRDYQPAARTPIPLPAQFKQMAGYYVPLNPRVEIMSMLGPIAGIMTFRTDATYLYREPLLGGWDGPSKDYAVNGDYLIESWTGLPTVAWVDDPLAGRVVQVGSDLFRPVSAFEAFFWAGLFLTLTLLCVLSLLAALFWGARRLLRKQAFDASVALRLWPLAAGLVMIAWFTLMTIAGTSPAALAAISPLTLSVCALSIAYPLTVLGGVLGMVRRRHQAQARWLRFYAAGYLGLHLIAVGYFLHFGMIGVRTWA